MYIALRLLGKQSDLCFAIDDVTILTLSLYFFILLQDSKEIDLLNKELVDIQNHIDHLILEIGNHEPDDPVYQDLENHLKSFVAHGKVYAKNSSGPFRKPEIQVNPNNTEIDAIEAHKSYRLVDSSFDKKKKRSQLLKADLLLFYRAIETTLLSEESARRKRRSKQRAAAISFKTINN
ncbi:hypothetical protein PPL_12083 [Heterostelium album PN500]|uniref:Uncharacterized protein n=1 Tax=Heterostelium pallidum (strain ATCC 26659 / Pp 5 / PN500) TaxID=670386 RepID=D3BLN0_HETP5|nr:hypothetical protein PPL_12083 [Heterostelium album PN500]EFA77481.1 hypothetical protein PPL_12083 [Heterostelium album PN500]|eukprot:XP_020429609.1 hypothetical protein PPL_12083 [Heterostelium album PN500]